MAELIISSISNGGIKANSLSENFSGLHQIMVVPQTTKEKKTVSIDGFSLNPVDISGLECISINDDLSTGIRDVFNFSNVADTNRFETWLNSVTSGIIIMISHGSNVTNTTINNVFKKIGNIGWEHHWDSSNGTSNTRYAAIYDCKLKKIMVEQIGVGDYVEVSLETIFDTFADIGVTGYGNSIIFDQTEYINEKSNRAEIKQFIDATLSSIVVNSGETIRFNLETYRDDLSKSAGESVRLYYIGYNGNTSVLSGYVSSPDNTSGQWDNVYSDFVVPSTINRIQVYATSWPQKAQYIGTLGVRSVTAYRKKPNVIKQGKATIGQWGFITEDAVETGGDVVGAIDGKNITSFEYGNLEMVSFPHFTYGQNKYISLPRLIVSNKFSYTSSIVYTDTNIDAMRIGSGSDDTIFLGMTTFTNPNGMGHMVVFSGNTIYYKTPVSCNKEYLYKLDVDGTSMKFYVDGILVGSTTITDVSSRVFEEIKVGSEMSGYIISSEYDDYVINNNSRLYEYPKSEKLGFIKGTSPQSGIYYSASNVTPDPSSSILYCGIGSKLIPAGMKEGSKVWVTLVENNGATLNTGVELNKRYECDVFYRGGDILKNNYSVRNFSWITSGNMSNLKFDVECITEPEIDGTKPDIEWVKNNKYSFKFDGTTMVEIPPVYALNNRGYITFNMVMGTTGTIKYIFDGRSNNAQEVQGGYVYINNANQIITSPEFKITKLNGVSVSGVQTIRPNIPYSVVLEFSIGGVIRTIGGRYSKTEGWVGKLWNIKIVGDNDIRTYINTVDSRFNSYSTGMIDSSHPDISVYNTVDLSKWKMSDELNQPIQVVSNNRFKFIKDVSEGGMTFNLNLPPRGRFRIEYDIDCPRPLHLKDVYGTTVGVGSIMKSLGAGRYKGMLIHNHTETTHDSGLYICVPNARVGDVVTIRSLVVYTNSTDGVGVNTQSLNYSFDEFDEPQMLGNTMGVWTPNTTNDNYLQILPKFTPNKDGYRIRFSGSKFAPMNNMLYSSDPNNGMFLNMTSTTLSFIVKVDGNTINNISLVHGIKSNEDWFVNIQYNRPSLFISANNAAINTTYEHVDNISSDRCFRNSSSILNSVEFIETTNTTDNSRVYKTTEYGFIVPNTSIIQNTLTFRKKFRPSNLLSGNGVIGWDSSLGDIAGNGRLKDNVYVYGDKISKVITGGSSSSMIIEFEGKITPYREIEVTIINSKGLPLTRYASVGTGNYIVPKDIDIDMWMAPSSQYRILELRPIGEVGLKLSSVSWI